MREYYKEATTMLSQALRDRMEDHCETNSISISKFVRIAVMEKLQRDSAGPVPSAFRTIGEAIRHYRPRIVFIISEDGDMVRSYRPENISSHMYVGIEPDTTAFNADTRSLTVQIDVKRYL